MNHISACPHNLIAMQMAMYVDLEAVCDTIWMQWDMTQDELIHEDTDTIQRIKSNITIVLILEDVMIATDKTLLAIQSLDMMQRLPIDDNITKMIHDIVRTNLSIPTVNHRLIHLFCRGEWAQRIPIGQLKLFPTVSMSESVCQR